MWIYAPARTSPFGFAAPYHFSVSPTCGFAFGDVEYTQHPALKGLMNLYNNNNCINMIIDSMFAIITIPSKFTNQN